MDGFTPSFFLQCLIAIGSAGAVYGAIRTDLNNLRRGLDEETRLREALDRETDESFHDIRDSVNDVGLKVAALEGAALEGGRR